MSPVEFSISKIYRIYNLLDYLLHEQMNKGECWQITLWSENDAGFTYYCYQKKGWEKWKMQYSFLVLGRFIKFAVIPRDTELVYRLHLGPERKKRANANLMGLPISGNSTLSIRRSSSIKCIKKSYIDKRYQALLQERRLMLTARELCEESLLYKDVFPLDLFKIIWGMIDYEFSI